MNADQREQIRLSLLRYLDAAAPDPLGFGLLNQQIRNEGFRVEARDTEAELAYLRDKGLVETAAKLLSPENKAWRITAAGRDFFAAQNR